MTVSNPITRANLVPQEMRGTERTTVLHMLDIWLRSGWVESMWRAFLADQRYVSDEV